jgi:hypothetical protein
VICSKRAKAAPRVRPNPAVVRTFRPAPCHERLHAAQRALEAVAGGLGRSVGRGRDAAWWIHARPQLRGRPLSGRPLSGRVEHDQLLSTTGGRRLGQGRLSVAALAERLRAAGAGAARWIRRTLPAPAAVLPGSLIIAFPGSARSVECLQTTSVGRIGSSSIAEPRLDRVTWRFLRRDPMACRSIRLWRAP